jgi:hypothetical protein
MLSLNSVQYVWVDLCVLNFHQVFLLESCLQTNSKESVIRDRGVYV